MARRQRDTRLPSPFLRSVAVRNDPAEWPRRYPFDLPWLDQDFELEFHAPVTILAGENGAGKSTLLEAIAALSGFSTSGGGTWADPALSPDASDAEALAAELRGAWLPKVTKGWFLKAQSFAAVSSVTVKDYLGLSHGEGFAEVVMDRMQGQGVFLMDEPEAALSPRRQMELLAFLADVQESGSAQVILSTHSPILMAVPGATLFWLSHRGIEERDFRDTEHFQFLSAFTADPDAFVAAARNGDLDVLT